MKRSELFFNIFLIPLDIISIIIGFALAYYIRKHLDPFGIIYIPTLKEYMVFISYFLPVWVLVFALIGLYNIKNTRKTSYEFSRILMAVPTALMLFVTAIFFIKESFFSRLIILYSLILIIAVNFLFRLVVHTIQKILFRYGIGVKKILVIGTCKTSQDIIDDIEKNPKKGFVILGIIKSKDDKDDLQCRTSIVGELKNLGSIVIQFGPDEIFQTDPTLNPQENLNIIHLCEDKHITFRYVPSLLALYSKNNDSDTFGQVPVFEIRRSKLEGWGRIIKRLMDILGSLVGITLSLPIQIIVAIIMKVTDPGPIFFLQERVGRDKNFNLVKFRTMKLAFCTGAKYGGEKAEKLRAQLVRTKNEASGPMFKMKDDPRVSKIGKLLRKTSLDEVPQFYNILRGDMSIVGPRPPLPAEVARYTRAERKRIIGVKPGLTGLWQVSGRSDIQFEDWVKLDTYYIENWSLFLDFVIILKTIWVIVFGKGAY